MKKTNWNQDWLFWQDQNSFALIWDVPKTAQNVTLPHDAMQEQPAYSASPNGGNTGFRDGGTYVYVKHLLVESQDQIKNYQLQFDGAYMNTFVFVNGQLAGKRPYGYSAFRVDLTPFLNFGADNEIRVQVKSGAMPNSRWYSGSGLIRDVYLLTSATKTYLTPTTQITTLQATTTQATINLATTIQNQTTNQTATLQLQVQIYDEQQQLILSDHYPVQLAANEQRPLQLRLSWAQPLLWSAKTPHLYRCLLQLSQQEQMLDQDELIFGVRQLALNATQGLLVNGQSVKLRGAGIHHDSGLLGAATYDVSAYRQIKLLKQAGFNAIRMAHQPAAPALLKACDELGMYVLDETFDMWNRAKSDYDYSLYFQEWWPQDLQAMVEKDFNHPSVILYSLGNEIPEIGTAQGISLLTQMEQLIKQLDPTRYTLSAVNGLYSVGNELLNIISEVVDQQEPQQNHEAITVNNFMVAMDQYLDRIVVDRRISQKLDQIFPITDLAGYNYMTARYEQDIKNHPQRLIVGTETYPPQIWQNWPLVQKYPQIIGDFTWTGWDYIGEAGVGIPGYHFGEGGFGAQFPAQLAYVGDFDLTGFRRPLSYYREIIFGLRTTPYLAVQDPKHYGEKLMTTPWMLSDTIHSWSFDVAIDAPVIVEVYSSASSVALYLNDQLIANQAVDEHCRVLFKTTYRPGKLTAVAYDEHQQVSGQSSLQTVTVQDAQLQVRVQNYLPEMKAKLSYQTLPINGDLYYLNVQLAAPDGTVCSIQEQTCQLQIIKGQAKILAFGSGNPKPQADEPLTQTQTFHGRALAVVQKAVVNQPVVLEVQTANHQVQQIEI